MLTARIILLVLGLGFVLMGGWFVILPEDLASGIFLNDASGNTLVEIGTYYGGSLLAIGFWWIFASNGSLAKRREALAGAALLNLILFTSRASLMVRIPYDEANLYVFGVIELACAIVAAFSWWLLGNHLPEANDPTTHAGTTQAKTAASPQMEQRAESA